MASEVSCCAICWSGALTSVVRLTDPLGDAAFLEVRSSEGAAGLLEDDLRRWCPAFFFCTLGLASRLLALLLCCGSDAVAEATLAGSGLCAKCWLVLPAENAGDFQQLSVPAIKIWPVWKMAIPEAGNV